MPNQYGKICAFTISKISIHSYRPLLEWYSPLISLRDNNVTRLHVRGGVYRYRDKHIHTPPLDEKNVIHIRSGISQVKFS